ncbi:MAG: single-stranded-DNA-specific exonuclease RecJ [Planctomycetota bacterium]|nr:single-stranded-DNA-specific exonuclease RecJ [Planctomycetota bacterium]
MARRAWRPGSQLWQIAPAFDNAETLARKLNTTPLVAQVLHNRGIDDAESARAFLNPKLTDLHEPQLLAGAAAAAKRIAEAVAQKQRIVLYGDYDVDGITGVAILHAFLTMVGADVHYYVPHRLAEGYGVNVEAVGKLAARGAELLITIDCGITATGPLAEAAKAGLDVIVTDHHAPGDTLPDVCAIVHPAVPPGSYPNPHLAGAGVAFKLTWQVAREICGESRVDEPMRNFLLDATCLAALGTIADVVPLLGENRVLAAFGLRGLRALLASAQLADEKLDAYHVAFMLAPRINAAGRMGHARLAVELLTGAAGPRCEKIADYLTAQNAERKKTERAITAQAVEMVESAGLDEPANRVIVLASADWHGGVIGIVASRLVDRFAKPAILVAMNGETGQGSARSIEPFNMCHALAACSEHLISCGGHAMAGGLKIAADKLDEFAAAMSRYAAGVISDRQLTPRLDIDAEATLASLGYQMVSHLVRLAPFGQGNPPPLVAVRSCELLDQPRRMGRSGQTVGMTLRQGGATLRAVGFGMGDLADELVGVNHIDVAAEPVLNSFNGRTSVELKLKDVQWR